MGQPYPRSSRRGMAWSRWTAPGGGCAAAANVRESPVCPRNIERMATRIVLGEDSLIAREGIEQILATAPEVEVVASCGDLDSLLEAVARETPDVVVTDIRMPPGASDEGIRAAAELRETQPEVGVLILSQYTEPAYV